MSQPQLARLGCSPVRLAALPPATPPRRREPRRTRADSFDDPIGAGEQCWRDGEAERLCCFQVDHQLEYSRTFDRKVGRLGTFQDAVRVVGKPAIGFQHPGVFCRSMDQIDARRLTAHCRAGRGAAGRD
jgi:hypothetical protein